MGERSNETIFIFTDLKCVYRYQSSFQWVLFYVDYHILCLVSFILCSILICIETILILMQCLFEFMVIGLKVFNQFLIRRFSN